MSKNGARNLVTLTNDSSTGSKASMAALGYFDDKIIGKFLSKIDRRSPLINRGYFIRVWAIDKLIRRFINVHENEQIQIVSCGAGFDSLFFRLREEFCTGQCVFVEADLLSVINKKREFLSNWSEFSKSPVSDVDNVCHFMENYILLPCDLRNADEFYNSLVSKCCFDEKKPTLFLAECVFNYLQPSEADKIIEHARKSFSCSTFIVYEQILPFDAFGRFMLDHFSNIGSPLTSISRYADVAAERKRFFDFEWTNVFCYDMLNIYRNILSIEKRRTINNLEPFDEYEMWHLKCSHYVLSVATLDDEFARNLLNDFNNDSSKICDNNFSHQTLHESEPLEMTHVDLDKSELKRFGHRCASVLKDNYVVVSGGLGQDKNGRHRRLNSLIAVNMMTNRVTNLIENAIFERCYHSLTTLNSTQAIIFGGRKSPKEPLADAYLLTFSIDHDAEVIVSYRSIDLNDGKPTARWRHAACCLSENSLFICGGMTWPYVILNDSWILFTSDENPTCRRIPDMPLPLHSHFCCCKQDKIYVYGGMTNVDDGFYLGLLVFDLKSNIWTVRSETSLPQGIFGHSGHLLDDDIVLIVGGVWENGQENHGFLVFNVNINHMLKVVQLPSNDKDLLMITNHCSIWLKNNSQLVIFGGGGNCFSFGTLLNSGLTFINFTPDIFRTG